MDWCRPLRVLILLPLLAGCATRSASSVAPAVRAGSAAPSRPEASIDTSIAVDPGSAVLADSSNSPLPPAVLETATGQATYYADMLAGRPTASGIPYRPEDMIAAHRTYPFGTVVRVTNLRNDRSVVVRIMDRGPWGDSARQRATIIDLSRAAAERLDYIRDGRIPVQVEVLRWGDSGG